LQYLCRSQFGSYVVFSLVLMFVRTLSKPCELGK
jgi:hypothetical protein